MQPKDIIGTGFRWRGARVACHGSGEAESGRRTARGMRHAETVTFGGSGLDRADALRGDPSALAAAAADPGTSVLPLWRGRPLLAGAARDRLARLRFGHAVLDGAAEPVLLGREGGRAVFAVDLSHWNPEENDVAQEGGGQPHPALPGDHAFCELRACMTALGARDAELAASARAVLGWHRSHRFCARCGAESAPARGGWVRVCGSCGAQHFPRTDPVVIMLVVSGPRVLLGRSPHWPERMYSLLAGYMEPGECVEAAVRREVMEEAGVRVGAVRYLASQPWPFPASLMLGCLAEAETEAVTLDPAELEDALWIGRRELLDVFAGGHPRIRPPRAGAIAGFLLRNWLADRLD